MKCETHSVVKRVSSFLGYNFVDSVITAMSDLLQFDKMKANEATNFSWMQEYHDDKATPFLRKGIIGDWKNHFTEEQLAKMDAIVAEKLRGVVGIVYNYGN